MKELNIHQIAGLLREKRGDRGIREVAREVGISPATLSRVERGFLPDLGTFARICQWLNVNPSKLLGFQELNAKEQTKAAIAHFRSGQTTTPKLAKALAQMILAAQDKLAN